METKNEESSIIKQIIEEDAEMQEQIFEEMYQEKINAKKEENENGRI